MGKIIKLTSLTQSSFSGWSNQFHSLTNLELVLNMLAEASTTEISKEKKPESLQENRKIAKQGGTIAGNTRREIEEKTGKKVVTKLNAKQLAHNRQNDALRKKNNPDE